LFGNGLIAVLNEKPPLKILNDKASIEHQVMNGKFPNYQRSVFAKLKH